MATRLINTVGCNSDFIVNLSIPFTTGTRFTLLTVEDSGSNPSFFASNSIVISTTSGYSFYGGGNVEYIRRSGDSLTFAMMSSNWVLINTYAYSPAGHALLCNVSTTHLFGLGTASLSTLIVQGKLTNKGPIDQQIVPTVQGIPVVSQCNLFSTVVGLGSLGYFSSIPSMMNIFISTIEGLSGYSIGYISSTQLRSTVAGLGSTYVSTGALTSTMEGLKSVYLTSSSLVSTVAGLGTYGYISASQLRSTVEGLGTIGYISMPQLISTVSQALSVTASNNASTFANLGLLYVSTPSLVSTILGASNIYINSNQFASTILGVTPYFSAPTVSTVAGLGSAGYISTLSLYSTVGGILDFNQCNVSNKLSSIGQLYVSSPSLQSTVAGLGTNFISLSHLTSTTAGALEQSQSNMNSTLVGLGEIYISSIQFVSTTVALSNNAAASFTSTLNGLGVTYISSPTLQSTVTGLGNYYVSIDQLVSTTSNILATVGNSLPSTLTGLGSVGYISFSQMISTVRSTEEINQSNIISTVNGLGNSYISTATLESTVAGLGTYYISLSQLTSTTTNVLVLESNYIQSTFAGLGTAGYISYPHAVSTVIGFCNINQSNLISTVNNNGFLYISSQTLTSTVAGLGTYGYLSLAQLTSTTFSVVVLASNYIQSTLVGMSNVGYVSVSQLSSTLIGIRNLDLLEYISATRTFGQTYISSTSLQSTVAGLGTFGYISIEGLVFATNGVITSQSNALFANLAAIANLTFISTSQLYSTVSGMLSTTVSSLVCTVNTLGTNFYSALSLQSMVNSLGTMNFVTGGQMNAAINQVNDQRFIVNPSLGAGFANLDDRVNSEVVGVYTTVEQTVSTTSTLIGLTMSNILSTVNTLGSIYLNTGLTSTVRGLGTYQYISRSYITLSSSNLIAASSNAIRSTFSSLGTARYISMPQLTSTTEGILSNTHPFFESTVCGIGSLYISSLSLQSTVGGLSNYYITSVQLISTRLGLPNPITTPPSMFSSLDGLGSTFVSSMTLQSTVAGMGRFYISTAHLVSTVNGLGSFGFPSTFGYLSTGYLTSTFSGYSNPMPQIISTTAGLGKIYISSPTGNPIFPDDYTTQTKYTGRGIRVMARSESFLFFADASNIYKSSFNPITETFFASRANITGMACDTTSLYVAFSNGMITYPLTGGNSAIFVNGNMIPGFDNSSSPRSPSLTNTVTFRSIQGICIDSSSKIIYACDMGNNAIRRVQINPLSVTTIAIINQPLSVAVDAQSNYVYVSGSEGITKICLFQSNISLLTSQGAYSRGISIDQSGTLLYVTSQINSCILEVNLLNGAVNPLAGTSGRPGLLDGVTSLFFSPQGIVYNPGDTCIYVADTGNVSIRQILSKIYYSTIQGMYSKGYAQTIGIQTPTSTTNTNQFITSPALQLWLDGADPNGSGTTPPTNVPANGSTLSIWRDKSGNSNHAMPVNTPLYSNGHIQLLPDSYFVSPYLMNSTEHHIFIVCQYSNSGTYDINLVSGMSNASLQVYIYNNTLVLGSPYSSQNRTTVSPNLPFVIEIVTTESYSRIYVNKNNLANGAGYVYDTSVTQIGGSITNMNICEVLLYNTIIFSTVTSSGVTDYLYSKWVAPALRSNASVIASNTAIISSNVAITTANTTLSTFLNSSASNISNSTIQLWLDGSDPNGNGVLPQFGSEIINWIDKSGKGNNATGSGVFSSNGILFGGNNFFNTPVLTNATNTYMFVVFSNTMFPPNAPLIGASQGSNVGIELLLANRDVGIQLSYPATRPTIESVKYTIGIRNFPIGYSDNTYITSDNSGNIYVAAGTTDRIYYSGVEDSEFIETDIDLARYVGNMGPINWCLYGNFILALYEEAYFNYINYFSNVYYTAPYQYRTGGGTGQNYNFSVASDGAFNTTDDYMTVVFIAAKVGVGSTNNLIMVYYMNLDPITRVVTGENYYYRLPDLGIASSGGLAEAKNDPWGSHAIGRGDKVCIDPSSMSTGYRRFYYTHENRIWRIVVDRSGKTNGRVDAPYVTAGIAAASGNSTSTGSGVAGYADGIPLLAMFNTPWGVACDNRGRLYIADSGNNKIRLYNPATNLVSTLPLGDLEQLYSVTDLEEITYAFNRVKNAGYLSCLCIVSGTVRSVMTIEIIENIDRLTSSNVTVSPQNTIVHARFVGGTGFAEISNGTGNFPTQVIANTIFGLNSQYNPNFGSSGTYQIGLYYNPSPVYLIGSIQEVIIYTSPLAINADVLNPLKLEVYTYLSRKWNPLHVPYYSSFPKPLLSVLPYLPQTSPSNVTIVPPGILSGTPTTANLTISGSTLLINNNLYAGNITAGSIQGELWGDGTNVTTISDRRLKEDIRPIMNALEKVSSMQAVRYRMYNDPSHLWIGYIAQDLEAILPELVRTDSEGWKSIQYTNLPGLIIEAVKELNEKYSRIKYLLSTST